MRSVFDTVRLMDMILKQALICVWVHVRVRQCDFDDKRKVGPFRLRGLKDFISAMWQTMDVRNVRKMVMKSATG